MELIRSLKANKLVTKSILIFSVTILIFSGYWWYWSFLETKILEAISDWRKDQYTEGYDFNSGPIEISGFPFWIRVLITKPSLSISNERQTLNWSGSDLTLSMRPWQLKEIAIEVPGQHIGMFKTKLVKRVLDVKVRNFRISLKLREIAGFPKEIHAEIIDVSHHTELIDGLGFVTKHISFQANVIGEMPNIIKTNTVQIWRDEGGVLEIVDLKINHNTLEINGAGTLAVDKNLQPLAVFSVKARGYMGIIDKLYSSGVINISETRLAKAILSMLASGNEQGGEGVERNFIKIPISIQDNTIYVGPLAVGHFPYLEWSSSN